MTLWQCAPEPPDVLASRRLTDGRSLCVFKVYDEPEVTSVVEDASVEVVAGEVRVSLAYRRHTLRVSLPTQPSRYALAVTDDTLTPEKWRTLGTRRSKAAALKFFHDFQEGDDDRRTRQSEDHPSRRADDLTDSPR